MKLRKGDAILIGLLIFELILWVTLCEKQPTIERMLQTALEPVGTTMYIWGGGWNEEDDKSGATSTRIGLSPQWEKYASLQGKDYDFTKHRFERENGLDCSGYVGWVVYNTFETRAGRPGYVTRSTDMAKSFAERGWGQLIENPDSFLPGDIVSMDGHVWICLGTCQDGSVLLVHSSPPGVSLCGTPAISMAEKEASMAVQIATDYMTTYHSNWQEKYPNREVPDSYLEEVTVFRWDKRTMKDAKELQNLSAEEIMRYISPDPSFYGIMSEM